MSGIFGIVHKEASRYVYLGLFAMLHRGPQGAGITSGDGTRLYSKRGCGKVFEIFDSGEGEVIDSLSGPRAIGHVRYSTYGAVTMENAQPISINSWRGELAIAHDGNLVNFQELRSELERSGAAFQSSSDAEVILHLLARSKKQDLREALPEVLPKMKGAYSFLLLTPKEIFAICDPYGVRPLSLGRIGSSYVIASETCAFDLIGAEYIRDIEPGEILRIVGGKTDSWFMPRAEQSAPCIFEHVYFSRPDSNVFGRNVHNVRFEMGRLLAREHFVEADFVIPVPDSGLIMAQGYFKESGIPWTMGLIRNHYAGRAFLPPTMVTNNFVAKMKLNPVRELIAGKRIILVDDSILRGNDSKDIVKMVFAAGAREVHLRVASSPIVATCPYGIDLPSNLIAGEKNSEQIRKHIGATSLEFLSLAGMRRAANLASVCDACFSRQYPIPAPLEGA